MEKHNKNLFYEYYKKEILPNLGDLEAERKKYRLYLLITKIILIAGFFAILANMIYGYIIQKINLILDPMLILAFYIPITPFLYFGISHHLKTKFSKRTKEFNMSNLICFFDNLAWRQHDPAELNPYDTQVKTSLLHQSGLFMHFDSRYIDDEFKGTYKDVPFGVSETSLVYASGRNRYLIFKGVILNFKFNKKIKARTIVAKHGLQTEVDSGIFFFLAFIVSSLEIFKHGYEHWKLIYFVIAIIGYLIFKAFMRDKSEKKEILKKIKLEDTRFNKEFNVYSSDEVASRCLVTPAFMERLLNLKTAFGGKQVRCSFIDKNLIVTIDTNKNLFEVADLKYSLSDRKNTDKFYSEIEAIYQMINYFKLYEKLYLSE